jgi:hypothetical protein
VEPWLFNRRDYFSKQNVNVAAPLLYDGIQAECPRQSQNKGTAIRQAAKVAAAAINI